MPPEGAENLFLALDQGGHASRALVFSARGEIRARGLRELSEYHPRADWVEQDPDEVVNSLIEVIREVEADLGSHSRDIVAAGLATQRSSIVCWDRISGAALSPVLSWQDRRAREWLQRFEPDREPVQKATGLVLSPHYGASKMRWCLDHLPDVEAAAANRRLVIGPLSSFLCFRLTEERTLAVDPANAARTLLWNVEDRVWDPRLLHLFGIPRHVLPDCVTTRFNYGRLTGGHRPTLSIVTGDQSAALFSRGRPETGQIYVNLGTGAFVLQPVVSLPVIRAPLLTSIVYHAGADTFFTREGTINGAGSALVWAQAKLGLGDVSERLDEWLADSEDPPLFLNGVGGLGSPFWIPDFDSRWIGEGNAMARVVAVAESIVFLIQSNLDKLMQESGEFRRQIVTGGLSRFDGLCQRLADLSQLDVARPSEHEATARGLAWLLSGMSSSWPGPDRDTTFRPQPNVGLSTRYDRWRQMMQNETGV